MEYALRSFKRRRAFFIVPSYGWQAIPMYYTYILESLSSPTQHYVGHTADLRKRLTEHNEGKCVSTAKYRPWKVRNYMAFETLEKAQAFEMYLKSGSGHAFRKKHF